MPYRHEGRDGYDTIEWAAAQPWSDGSGRDVRPLLPGRRPVAGRGRVAAAPHGHGAGHDVLHPRQLLLLGRRLRPVLDRPGSGTTSPPTSAAEEPSRPAHGGRRTRPGGRVRAACDRGCPARTSRELREIAPYYFDWMSMPPGRPVAGPGGHARQVRATSRPPSSTSRAGTTRPTDRRARSRTTSGLVAAPAADGCPHAARARAVDPRRGHRQRPAGADRGPASGLRSRRGHRLRRAGPALHGPPRARHRQRRSTARSRCACS